MPGMNKEELMQTIRCNQDLKETRILVLSVGRSNRLARSPT